MGTWGPGPFDSDSAQDLIDFLAKWGNQERREVFRRIFADGLRLADPDVDLYSSDVIAAAALTAMNVPGNDWYDTWIDDDLDGEAALSARAVAEVLRDFLSAGEESQTLPLRRDSAGP